MYQNLILKDSPDRYRDVKSPGNRIQFEKFKQINK